MIKNGYRYVRTLVDGDKFLKDTGNCYTLVGQRKFNCKTDANGNVLLEEGVTVTLQIIDDNSSPVYDKETGEKKEDNRLETFEATIIGADYPLPMQKGDIVKLDKFMPEYSFYINYVFILRFGDIAKA